MVAELLNYQARALSSLVHEARLNEDVGHTTENGSPFPSGVNSLVGKLIRQAPNRLYYNPDGRVLRVFIFSEKERAVQARIQVEEFRAEVWEPIRGEFVSCLGPQDLEKLVTSWRVRYQMFGDILSAPDTVFQIRDPRGRFSSEFMHLVGDPSLSYLYFLSALKKGPREIALTQGRLSFRDLRLIERFSPPKSLITYTQPFTTP